jgi:hypothetical protein
MVRITGHVVCLLLLLTNGFILLVLRCKPYIPWILSKFRVCVVEILPLLGIIWMSKFSIIFARIKSMPTHTFGILRVCEQTPQLINHMEVPYH